MALKKILLAEDDADDQELFREFLMDYNGIDIMPMIDDGTELIKYLENITSTSNLPDIIILDQNMPKQGGLQTLQMIKGDERFNHIPIMVYSTFIDRQLQKIYNDAGAVIVITKPVTKNGYHQMMDEFLSQVS